MFGRWKRKRVERKLLGAFAKRYPINVGSPYNAVVLKAFHKFLAHLDRSGDIFTPQFSETHRQYFVKVEMTKKVPLLHLYGFLGVAERAVYSGKDVRADGKEEAICHLRELEKALDASSGNEVSLCAPSNIPLERPAIVAPPFRRLPDLSNYSEVEGTRDTANDELSAVEAALRPKNVAQLAPSPPGIRERMKEDVRSSNMRGLREAFGEIHDDEVTDVRFDQNMLRYVLELRYRSMEMFGTKWRNETALSAKIVRDAQKLAMAEVRRFLVPDDIKISFLARSDVELPFDVMRREELLDSTAVPSMMNRYSEVRLGP